MDLFQNLALGLSVAVTPINILYCLVGVTLGTLVGVLPGIGPIATIAMLLPATFSLDPTASLIMLAGIYYGAQYGGSTTAILVNLPGEASSAVTCLDGFQMARQGRASQALIVAALGSFFAGTVATLVLGAFAIPLASFAVAFGAAEYFALMATGLIIAVTLAHGSVVKALGMVILGLLFGIVGTDVNSNVERFSFGRPELLEGIGIVIVAMALFGIADIILSLEGRMDREVFTKGVPRLWISLKELKQAVLPVIRGTVLGSILGILPGGGAPLAAFASYAFEKRIAKDPSRFGNGAIEGVAGPEAANNAGAQLAFAPLLTLGIPSNGVMALMLGALMIHNIQPGPDVIVNNPDLFWGVIASMWVGNALLVVLNLPMIRIWIKLLTVPYEMLYPTIVLFICIGVYSLSNSTFDVFLIAGFGVLGYVFLKLKCEPAPFLLGFILGPLMEENLRRALRFSGGDPSTFVSSPISVTLLGIGALLLILLVIPMVRSGRKTAFAEGEN